MGLTDLAVMYHYIRDDVGLNAFPPAALRQQLDSIAATHDLVALECYLQPSDAPRCVLTFDDGLKDGYLNALPILEEVGVKGVFFIPTCILVHRKVIPAQKRAFILRQIGVESFVKEFNELAPSYCRIEEGVAMDEYNDPLVSILKYVLDHMPHLEAERIVDDIFSRYFDEEDVFDNLYLSIKEVREMLDLGHCVAGHGHDHRWLGNLYAEHQLSDLTTSVAVFRDIVGAHPRFMSYPFGSRNRITLMLLKHLGFEAAFLDPTSAVERETRFELNRFDCIDLVDGAEQEPLSRRTKQA